MTDENIAQTSNPTSIKPPSEWSLDDARMYAAEAKARGHDPLDQCNAGWLVRLDAEIERLRAALANARKGILTVDDLLKAHGFEVDSSARNLLMCVCPDEQPSDETSDAPKRAYYETHEPPHCPTCDCGAEKASPQAPAIDEGKLWSFLRDVMAYGCAIETDTRTLGRRYEEHSARLDAAARDAVPQFAERVLGVRRPEKAGESHGD